MTFVVRFRFEPTVSSSDPEEEEQKEEELLLKVEGAELARAVLLLSSFLRFSLASLGQGS